MKDHQARLIQLSYENKILTFGDFTLKSGRKSPYFFNSGFFCAGDVLGAVADSYAQTIIDAPDLEFDIILGPAYKGIPLAAVTIVKLAEKDPAKYGKMEYAYNRKEKKDHGEGGNTVGGSLKGKRVLILDDVMTAGTAIRESMALINAESGILAGVVLILDRQERMVDYEHSMIAQVKRDYGVPIYSIITLDDIVQFAKGKLPEEDIKKIEDYREKYKANPIAD
ncbi:phosphoribosyltransferase-like protein [Lipomyces doorenjongii]|uniref:phosphoribosyltransferase-like protein n=1 Tax=Lipomyces doorenjongii TaxID=383834 RepID=UPI0034CD258E